MGLMTQEGFFVFRILKHLGKLGTCAGEIFDYLLANGRLKERDARMKFRQVLPLSFIGYHLFYICTAK